jgi:hypothetical protein
LSRTRYDARKPTAITRLLGQDGRRFDRRQYLAWNSKHAGRRGKIVLVPEAGATLHGARQPRVSIFAGSEIARSTVWKSRVE